jgi:zinc transport system substrate-binding protein
LGGQAGANETPLRVLTTVKPLQLIAATVLGDPQQVELLLDPRMSPHDYQLRPSDRAKLDRADVVFWIGPTLERFLVPVLSSLPKQTKVVSLQAATAEVSDPHIWMDPLIAAAIANQMADILGARAPRHSALWHANAERLESALIAEDQRLRQQLSSIQTPRGYLVVHDAYARFETRYGLQHRAALTNNADLPPSAQHIANIQKLLDAGDISCVMQEAAMPPKVLQTLLKDRQLRVQTIDSLGLEVSLEEGIVGFYRKLGESMRECLQP